jgi:hypothetical protein
MIFKIGIGYELNSYKKFQALNNRKNKKEKINKNKK